MLGLLGLRLGISQRGKTRGDSSSSTCRHMCNLPRWRHGNSTRAVVPTVFAESRWDSCQGRQCQYRPGGRSAIGMHKSSPVHVVGRRAFGRHCLRLLMTDSAQGTCWNDSYSARGVIKAQINVNAGVSLGLFSCREPLPPPAFFLQPPRPAPP